MSMILYKHTNTSKRDVFNDVRFFAKKVDKISFCDRIQA